MSDFVTKTLFHNALSELLRT